MAQPVPVGADGSIPMEPWMTGLPPTVLAPVLAFADPHPPGARARAMYAATAVAALARSWPAGEPGLRLAIDDLVAHLHAVGQSTIHQPGIGNTLAYVLAGDLPDDPGRPRRSSRLGRPRWRPR